MSVCILAGQDARPGRRAEGGGHRGVLHPGPFTGHAVHVGRLEPGDFTGEAHEVEPVIVCQNKYDIGSLCRLGVHFSRTRDGQHNQHGEL